MTQAPEWRYFPELLRNLERVARGDACDLCAKPTDVLQGPRATLSWCPRCHVLSVREGTGGLRSLGVFSVAARPAGEAAPTAADSRAPSEVPRLAPSPRPAARS